MHDIRYAGFCGFLFKCIGCGRFLAWVLSLQSSLSTCIVQSPKEAARGAKRKGSCTRDETCCAGCDGFEPFSGKTTNRKVGLVARLGCTPYLVPCIGAFLYFSSQSFTNPLYLTFVKFEISTDKTPAGDPNTKGVFRRLATGRESL